MVILLLSTAPPAEEWWRSTIDSRWQCAHSRFSHLIIIKINVSRVFENEWTNKLDSAALYIIWTSHRIDKFCLAGCWCGGRLPSGCLLSQRLQNEFIEWLNLALSELSCCLQCRVRGLGGKSWLICYFRFCLKILETVLKMELRKSRRKLYADVSQMNFFWAW